MSNGTTSADEVIEQLRRQYMLMCADHNLQCSAKRKLQLDNWMLNKTMKDPNLPRPNPVDKRWVYVDVDGDPYATHEEGGWIDFPNYPPPPPPTGKIDMLPAVYDVTLKGGAPGKVRLEGPTDTMLDSMAVGQQVMHEGYVYTKVEYHAAMTTATAYGL